MKTLLLLSIFAIAGACGRVDHNFRASGTATVRHTVDIEFCDKLPAKDRLECIQAVLDIINRSEEANAPTPINGSY
jgi:hypothetical protein